MKALQQHQKDAIVELLWDYMKRDPEHGDRVRTGWGTKTKQGLAACIERIVNDDALPALGEHAGDPA